MTHKQKGKIPKVKKGPGERLELIEDARLKRHVDENFDESVRGNIVAGISRLGSTLDEDKRTDFYEFATSPRFLGLVKDWEDPVGVLGTIHDLCKKVSPKLRTYFLYGLVPKGLTVFRDNLENFSRGITGVINAARVFDPEDRFWIYHGTPLEEGLGCTALEALSDKPANIGRVLRIAGNSSKAVDVVARRNFVLDLLPRGISTYGKKPQELENALKTTTESGEKLDEYARREFYSFTASSAIVMCPKKELGKVLETATKQGEVLDPVGRRNFYACAIPGTLETYKGKLDELDSVMGIITKFGDRFGGGIRGVARSIYYRDTVSAIVRLGPDLDRIEKAAGISFKIGLEMRKINEHLPKDFYSNMYPKMLNAINTYSPDERVAILDIIEQTTDRVTLAGIWDFSHVTLPKAIETFGVARRIKKPAIKTEYQADWAVSLSERLRDWLNVFVDMGEGLPETERPDFYGEDAPNYLEVVAEISKPKMLGAYSNDLNKLRRGLQIATKVGKKADPELQKEFYTFAGTTAMGLLADNPQKLEESLDFLVGLRDISWLPERNLYRNTGDTAFKVYGSDTENFKRALDIAVREGERVPQNCQDEFYHWVVPTAMRAYNNDLEAMRRVLRNTVTLSLKEEILEDRKENFFGFTATKAIEVFGPDAESANRALEKLVQTFIDIESDEEAADMFNLKAPQLLEDCGGDLQKLVESCDAILRERPWRDVPPLETIKERFGEEVHDFVEQQMRETETAVLPDVWSRKVGTNRGEIFRVGLVPSGIRRIFARKPIKQFVVKRALDDEDVEAQRTAYNIEIPDLERGGTKTVNVGPQLHLFEPRTGYMVEEYMPPDRQFHNVNRSIDTREKALEFARVMAETQHAMIKAGIYPREHVTHLHPMVLEEHGKYQLKFIDHEKIAEFGFQTPGEKIAEHFTEAARTFDFITYQPEAWSEFETYLLYLARAERLALPEMPETRLLGPRYKSFLETTEQRLIAEDRKWEEMFGKEKYKGH